MSIRRKPSVVAARGRDRRGSNGHAMGTQTLLRDKPPSSAEMHAGASNPDQSLPQMA